MEQSQAASVDVTYIAGFFICFLFSVIVCLLIPYIKEQIAIAKENSEASKRENIEAWVTFAVNAAEMLFTSPKSGKDKLDYVMEYIERLLQSKGMTWDKQEIRMMIESKVLELKTHLK